MAVWAAVVLGLAVWWGCGPPPLTRLKRAPAEDRGGWWRAMAAFWQRIRTPDPPWSEIARACDLLAVCVESGMPLRAASRVVAEVSEGEAGRLVGEVVARLEVGVDEPDAWLALRERPGLRGLCADVARAVREGTTVGAVLRTHAAAARGHARSVLVVRARQVGVSAVLPVTVCFLPAFMLLGVVPIFASLGELFALR